MGGKGGMCWYVGGGKRAWAGWYHCVWWLQFDFAKEDVPERDPSQVARDMEETREILASIQTEMVCTYVYTYVRI